MTCTRCKTDMENAVHCPYCGKHRDRVVRKSRRSRPIGGKRGRNSGTTFKSKVK